MGNMIKGYLRLANREKNTSQSYEFFSFKKGDAGVQEVKDDAAAYVNAWNKIYPKGSTGTLEIVTEIVQYS